MTALASPPATAAPAVAARPARRRPRWQRAVSPLVILAGWEALSRGGVLSPDKLPAPSTVLRTGGDLAADGTLGAHLADSLTRAAAGLLIGGVLALILGAVAGLLRLGDDAIDPPVQMARMLPHLALVPLLIIWVGIGEPMKITLVALGVFFPLYFNVYAGIRDIDERLVEAARTCGLGTWARLRHVILPGSLPSLFLGLRLAIGAAWLSLVVGEQTNTQNGIGFLMMEAREFGRTDVVVVGLFVYAGLGLLSDLLLRALERRALQWRRGLRAA
ncbi:ABC transporter permease [Actinoplanes sp. NBRC 14428]|uniref:Sulfonate transport system permease protein n=1 Tax=Pseudosporangium ferrugineum TaxID=439699 RepID=A0A2T0RKE4_9ACTN|nr:ABC transporter permease [Pseudosporangium ferrugineum]PRY21628.1 sulfonate transport system permease protein [Pseudosporangium ferrugineum]BCJ49296.1 ABC transporter permease [Actinoplanes sp. NBRC 14428]